MFLPDPVNYLFGQQQERKTICNNLVCDFNIVFSSTPWDIIPISSECDARARIPPSWPQQKLPSSALQRTENCQCQTKSKIIRKVTLNVCGGAGWKTHKVSALFSVELLVLNVNNVKTCKSKWWSNDGGARSIQHTFNTALLQRIGWTRIISSSFLILQCRLWTGEFPPARISWTRSRNRKTGKNLSGPAQVRVSLTRENLTRPRPTLSSPRPIIKSLLSQKTQARAVKWPRLRLRYSSRMTGPTPASCMDRWPPSPRSSRGRGRDSRRTWRASVPPRLSEVWTSSGKRSWSTRQWITLGKRYFTQHSYKKNCHHLKGLTPQFEMLCEIWAEMIQKAGMDRC